VTEHHPQHHPHFVGTYWGDVSTDPFCSEIAESADEYILIGPISVRYSLLLKKEKAIIAA